MLKSDLSVVVSNSHPVRYEESDLEIFEVEEIMERRGLPDFKFFAASTEQDLDQKIRAWREAEVVNNPQIEGVVVMSPTVSDDGVWRITVNFLVFEDSMDPWS